MGSKPNLQRRTKSECTRLSIAAGRLSEKKPAARKRGGNRPKPFHLSPTGTKGEGARGVKRVLVRIVGAKIQKIVGVLGVGASAGLGGVGCRAVWKKKGEDQGEAGV